MENRAEQLRILIQELDETGYDIRNMTEYHIYKYLTLKFKHLDFGCLFDRENAIYQLEIDYDLDGPTEYTEEQWEHVLENLWAEDEFMYIEDFLRVLLQKLHEDFPDVYNGLSVRPLNI